VRPYKAIATAAHANMNQHSRRYFLNNGEGLASALTVDDASSIAP
jgi:hypothetical protein